MKSDHMKSASSYNVSSTVTVETKPKLITRVWSSAHNIQPKILCCATPKQLDCRNRLDLCDVLCVRLSTCESRTNSRIHSYRRSQRREIPPVAQPSVGFNGTDARRSQGFRAAHLEHAPESSCSPHMEEVWSVEQGFPEARAKPEATGCSQTACQTSDSVSSEGGSPYTTSCTCKQRFRFPASHFVQGTAYERECLLYGQKYVHPRPLREQYTLLKNIRN